MCKEIYFIKILDEKIASTLSDGGFSYIKEKINGTQNVYVFEKTTELMDVISKINENCFQEVVCIEANSLHF